MFSRLCADHIPQSTLLYRCYKMAKSLGIAPSTWKNYEEDVTLPSTELIMRFGELYNVNPHWLMTNFGNMYKEAEKL